MKALPWITVASLALGSPLAHGGAPNARAGVFVLESDAETGEKVTSYAESERPGAGRTLTVRADSNGPAVFLVAAFERTDGRLTRNLTPLLVERKKRFREIAFPDLEDPSTTEWKFEEPAVHSELFVLVFRPDDAGLVGLRKIVAALAAASEDAPRLLLAKALRKEIGLAASRQARSEFRVRYRPASVAATLRGGDDSPAPPDADPSDLAPPLPVALRKNPLFRWQDELFYRKDLPDSGPAILSFHIGPPEEAGESGDGGTD